jgi:hypothetical protein
MVIRVDVEAALRQLVATRNRIIELLEWQALSVQERRQPKTPIFDLDTVTADHIREDLVEMDNLFFSLDLDVAHVLDRPDLECTPQQRGRWRRRRECLEEQVARLRIGERFKRR